MFNQLLLCAALTNIQQMSLVNMVNQNLYVRQYYVPPATSNVHDSLIDTTKLSQKNEHGAYPWEIVKPYGDSVYFLYDNYFRMGKRDKADLKMYYYFQGLNRRKRDITRRLMNPTDYKKVTYFNMNNLLAAISFRIDKAKSDKSLWKLLYYRQVVLDLQKEVLDFKQTILEMTLNMP